jgi:hypothetical protein
MCIYYTRDKNALSRDFFTVRALCWRSGGAGVDICQAEAESFPKNGGGCVYHCWKFNFKKRAARHLAKLNVEECIEKRLMA